MEIKWSSTNNFKLYSREFMKVTVRSIYRFYQYSYNRYPSENRVSTWMLKFSMNDYLNIGIK